MKNGPQTVMVIDDDPLILRLFHTLLTKTGYVTILAPRGHDAYHVIREQQPDVVILDLQLETPDMANRVLECMAADPVTNDIPVIMCSGDGALLHETAEHWRRPGDALLAKPFQIDELVNLVQSTLNCQSTSCSGMSSP